VRAAEFYDKKNEVLGLSPAGLARSGQFGIGETRLLRWRLLLLPRKFPKRTLVGLFKDLYLG
jgi:hypothetical protein